MSYRLVTVSPLKSFPLLSLGLANVVSFDDAKKQILEKYKKLAKAKIDADDDLVDTSEPPLNADGRAKIFRDHEKIAEQVIEAFENDRWPKIEPALKAHLARQERRLVCQDETAPFLIFYIHDLKKHFARLSQAEIP